MDLLVVVLVVVLLLGLVGLLNIYISVNTLIRDKPINDTIDRATRPFLGASIIVVGFMLFLIWWGLMARIGY